MILCISRDLKFEVPKTSNLRPSRDSRLSRFSRNGSYS